MSNFVYARISRSPLVEHDFDFDLFLERKNPS